MPFRKVSYAMKAQVFRWGNSLAIRLPKAAVESLQVREGEAVDLAIHDDTLVLRATRPRYRLDDLVSQITPENQPEAKEFPPAGDEWL
jgi:antitoxin component of MazEF toxin-antitoxin module